MRFDAAELAVLSETQPIAEELVGERFGVTSFSPPHRCYEIVTLAAGGDECREPRALAMLSRYDRSERPIGEGHRVARFYRLCIQDDNILARVESEGFQLRALLLYVLTHELIHIVRFESFQVHHAASGAERFKEEETVHDLTKDVLAALHDRAVDTVAGQLSPAGVDVLVTQR